MKATLVFASLCALFITACGGGGGSGSGTAKTGSYSAPPDKLVVLPMTAN